MGIIVPAGKHVVSDVPPEEVFAAVNALAEPMTRGP